MRGHARHEYYYGFKESSRKITLQKGLTQRLLVNHSALKGRGHFQSPHKPHGKGEEGTNPQNKEIKDISQDWERKWVMPDLQGEQG